MITSKTNAVDKLNILLAKVDHGKEIFKNLISGYIGYFKTKQAQFRGEKKTYQPNDNTLDEPARRGNTLVVTTVGEKLDYMVSTVSDYINNDLSAEATNASGRAVAPLEIGGTTYSLSSLELMKLKNIVEQLKPVYEEIPVRADNEKWDPNTSEDYSARNGIFQTAEATQINKTTLTEDYILDDPNAGKTGSAYKAVTSQKKTIVTLGTGTVQKFTGEWSHVQRAKVLDNRSKLLEKILVALKTCNEAETTPSEMTASALFAYLHG